MKCVGKILAACAVLYAVRLAIFGLFVSYLIAVTLALIFRPRETLGAFAFWSILALFRTHPLAAVALGVVSCALASISPE